jgi:hypothetical protein
MQRLSGQKTCSKAEEFKKNAERPGEIFFSCKHSSKTLFGREHDFENIRSVKDFQDRVPVADYEDLKPYIERVKKGQANILWTDTLNILPKLQEPLRDQNTFLFLKKECLFRCRSSKCSISLYQQKKQCRFCNGK